MSPKTLVIIGGGFAGVACAKRLRAGLRPAEARIVLFSEENYIVFQPLLAEVAGCSIQPEVAAAPLRVALRGVECRREKVLDVVLPENRLVYETFEGVKASLHYDHVIVACGSGVNLTAVPGMADHALPFRTVADAVTLRTQISNQLEQAAVTEDAEKRRFQLTFAVIGGGFSGVEVAGEINDLLLAAKGYYPSINPEEAKVILIHSRDQLLPEVSSSLREFTRKKMEQNGVQIVLKQRVRQVSAEGVKLNDGTFFRAATVVGTVGTAPHPFVERMHAEKDGGRLLTQPDMRLKAYDNAWAIGDCALVMNAFNNEPAQPTGQLAEREGKQCAANILAALRGQPTKPFYFRPLGMLCAIGGHNAVAEIMGIQLSGFFAWWLWRSIYLMKLPTFSRKVKVALDWTWELIFGRDLTGVKIDRTNRVQDAYFAEGSFVFRKGDPATDFYVVEKGSVEVLRQIEDGKPEEVVAVFGPGDFFGEMALVEDRPRNASVRARTDTEITIIGKNMFARMSRLLAPLAQQVQVAIRKRSAMRQKLPQSTALLKASPLGEFLEPLPSAPMRETCTFVDAVSQFQRDRADFFCVVDEREHLSGVLTRTDLLNAVEALALTPPEQRAHVLVRDVMAHNPLWITAQDNPLLAAEMMRERGLKRLPVLHSLEDRRLAGYIRLESLMDKVLKNLVQTEPAL
ncbi:MAG: FAD-dependent oxidoreductase [Bryobacter sp.]|nr:FAD-dependent oxidoreductase [Bryobacter sp.]